MVKVLRSPNYPVISLNEAIKRVKLIYEKEHRFPAPREVLAQDLSYGSLNGSSASVLSALTKYGLLEPNGDDNFRVSTTAIDILLHESGEPERVNALQRAAFRPALFNELHSLYEDSLPSERTLGVYLEKKGFNPKSLSGVIRAYRDTIEFVKEETRHLKETPPDAEEGSELETRVPVTPNVQQQTPIASQGAAYGPGLQASQQPATEGSVLWFNLSEDCTVRAEFSGHVTQEAVRKFMQLLEVSLDTFPRKQSQPQQQALFSALTQPQ